MKSKFLYLTKISLKRKIKTKWFFAANTLIGLIILAVFNIDSIIRIFGGDFNETNNIYVIDNTLQSFDLFKVNLEQNISSIDGDYEIIKYDKSKEEAIDFIKNEDENGIVLLIDNDLDNIIKVSIITNDYIETLDYTMITNSLNSLKLSLAISKYDISEEEISALTSSVNVERQILNEDKSSEEENMSMIMTTVFPVIILPFFMLVIFLVQMIGAEVNDEKTTRGMEIIISNISPSAHLFSKCLAGNLFIIIQTLLLLVYCVVGFISRGIFTPSNNLDVSSITNFLGTIFSSNFISSLNYIIPLIIILMLITFVAYSILAGVLASMTTNTEDFQQVQTPIMLITLAGYYLAIMAGAFEGSLLIKILGYFPFISAILSPSLLIMGDFAIIDILISILIMIITVFVLLKYGLKIYKVGILNYSSSGLFKKMFKALKEK